MSARNLQLFPMSPNGRRPRVARIGLALAGVAACLVAPVASARVAAVEIESRRPVLDGRPFGTAGAYELLEGRVRFEFDPESPGNASITDIALAEQDEAGRVHAEADLSVLQAVDPARRRGTALIEAVNRGRRLALGTLARGRLSFRDATLDPDRAEDFGDGFLMELGLTVVWIGWQHDAPGMPGALRIRVPVARDRGGEPIRGLARSDWVVEAPTRSLTLAAPGHTPLPVDDRTAKANVLTVRSTRTGPRRTVPRERWRFDESGTRIVSDEGFTAGHIYELVYAAADPPIAGLGLAAFRDLAAHVRHDDGPFAARRTVALGTSQSGRFLRHLLFEGLTVDEQGREAFDGLVVHIAGAGRGGFDHRFGQPGRVGNPFRNFHYPGDDFPFAGRPTTDPVTGERAGLFDRLRARDAMPRVFQVNTGYEYWGRAASLIHTTPDGARDVDPLPSERLYQIASAPHFPLPFPPSPEQRVAPGVYRGSPLETSSVMRALLVHMLDWVETGKAPPPSRVPRISNGTLVPPESVASPLPGRIEVPSAPHRAARLDYGPRVARGIVDRQPPERGASYALRAPATDAMGHDRGGIRPVAVRVPIATHLPWALRTSPPFAGEMIDYLGTFVPLTRTASEREALGDPRASIAERYPTRKAYRAEVEAAVTASIEAGFLLERDRDYEIDAAEARWEWVTRDGDQGN